MFEAVVILCLAEPEGVCRQKLLPGYEAQTEAACQQNVAALPDALCVPAGPVLPVSQIAPGIWVHLGQIAEPDTTNKGDVSNLGFIIGDDSVAVIDSGAAPWISEALWRAIRSQTEKPVSHVILTHMHPDHVLGAGAIQQSAGQVVGHEHLPRALADRQENYLQSLRRLVGEEFYVGFDAPQIGQTISGSLTVDLGDRPITLTAWPVAHTGTDLTVLDQQTGTLFAGDLIFDRHAPALDGSLTGWQAVLQELADKPLSLIVPGHGGPVLPWPAGGADTRRYLDVLAADTRAAVKAGERIGTAVEHIAKDEAARWQLFGAYNARNATVAFTELEWE